MDCSLIKCSIDSQAQSSWQKARTGYRPEFHFNTSAPKWLGWYMLELIFNVYHILF